LSTGPVAHAHGVGITALGLLMRPGAAACLLGAATGALVNQVLPWAAPSGAAEAECLEEAVHRSGSHMARLRAPMDRFGRTMRAMAEERHQAHSRLCAAAVGWHGALAGDAPGLGRRQLEQRCRAVLGVGPKQARPDSAWWPLATRNGRSHGQLTSEWHGA